MVWLLATRRRSVLLHIALGMVLAGALGNLYDRFHWHKVRDFFLVYIGRAPEPVLQVAQLQRGGRPDRRGRDPHPGRTSSSAAAQPPRRRPADLTALTGGTRERSNAAESPPPPSSAAVDLTVRLGDLVLAESRRDGLGHLREGPGVPSLLRRGAPRLHRGQDDHAGAPRRKPEPPPRRDAGRPAQLDRPARTPGSRRTSRRPFRS